MSEGREVSDGEKERLEGSGGTGEIGEWEQEMEEGREEGDGMDEEGNGDEEVGEARRDQSMSSDIWEGGGGSDLDDVSGLAKYIKSPYFLGIFSLLSRHQSTIPPSDLPLFA